MNGLFFDMGIWFRGLTLLFGRLGLPSQHLLGQRREAIASSPISFYRLRNVFGKREQGHRQIDELLRANEVFCHHYMNGVEIVHGNH